MKNITQNWPKLPDNLGIRPTPPPLSQMAAVIDDIERTYGLPRSYAARSGTSFAQTGGIDDPAILFGITPTPGPTPQLRDNWERMPNNTLANQRDAVYNNGNDEDRLSEQAAFRAFDANVTDGIRRSGRTVAARDYAESRGAEVTWLGNTPGDGVTYANARVSYNGEDLDIRGRVVDGQLMLDQDVLDRHFGWGGRTLRGAEQLEEAAIEEDWYEEEDDRTWGQQLADGAVRGVTRVGMELAPRIRRLPLVGNVSVSAAQSRDNYEHNSQFDFRGGFINDQNAADVRDTRLGTMPSSWNGCGWVAMHNANVILGLDEHHASIIRELEESPGIIVGGLFGTTPTAIADYYRRRGFDTTFTTRPDRVLGGIDDRIRNSRVSILTYWNGGTAHTVMVRYMSEGEYPGRFTVYNDNTVPGWSPATRGVTSSIDEWLRGYIRLNTLDDRRFQPWSLITLR